MDEKKYLNGKVVVINGFTREEVFRIVRAVKAASESPGEVAFAMTTENSLEMKLKDVIIDVASEHEYMTRQQRENS